MDPDAYLDRFDADRPERPTLAGLERLQRAHVTTIPWETLAIAGDPAGRTKGEGVSLAVPDLYEKIVRDRRGGFCYELNGLFGWLLRELGYDLRRVPAAVLDDDGAPRPPANHLSHVVTVDGRRFVVDVGLGIPTMRRPTPFDGDSREDEVGVTWRVRESDRPDADYVAQFTRGDEWTDRYVFRARPVEMDHFAATSDYLQSAPESSFTDGPVVSRATEDGHVKLTDDALVRYAGGETTEAAVAPEEWHAVLAREFDLTVP